MRLNNIGKCLREFLIFFLMVMLVAAPIAWAVELVRQKNVATHIIVPIVDADGDPVTAAAGLDSEFTYFADNTAGINWADCASEAAEIEPASGWYDLALSQAEMNHDYIAVQIKTSTSGAKTEGILIRTTVGAPPNIATTDDGSPINVTGGAIDTVTTATTATNLTNAPTNGDLTATMKTSVTTAATSSTPALSAAGVDAIWDEVVTLHSTASSFGKLLIDYLNASVSSRSTLTAANVWDTNVSAYSGAGYAGTYLKGIFDKLPTNYLMGSAVLTAKDDEIDNIKTKTDFLPSATAGAAGGVFIAGTNAATTITTALTTTFTGNLTGSVNSLTTWDKSGYALSADGVTAIWNKDISGYSTAGYAGTYLKGAGSAGDPWTTVLPGAYGATTAGYIIGTNLNATISSRMASGNVTVGTNNDKTGYTCSTVSDKTGYSLSQTFPTNFSALSISATTGLVDITQTAADKVWGTTVRALTDKAGFALSSAGIDAIWDEVQTGHSTASSFGLYLDAPVSTAGGGGTSIY